LSYLRRKIAITKLWRFYDRKFVIRFFENRSPEQGVYYPRLI